MGCNTKNKEDHSASGRRKYFHCSMDPQKEDKPGKCPICHMDLPQSKKIIQLLMKLPKRSTNKIGQYNYPKYRETNNSLKKTIPVF
jgi:Cu(I)/Ag(I) efflux system membrane fusion protein